MIDTHMEHPFPLTTLCRLDVESVLSDELKPFARGLTNDQMRHIADRISENCVGYGSYWELCEDMGEEYVKENNACGECGNLPCNCEVLA